MKQSIIIVMLCIIGFSVCCTNNKQTSSRETTQTLDTLPSATITKHNGLYIDDFSSPLILWVIDESKVTIYHEYVGYDIRHCKQTDVGVTIPFGNESMSLIADGQGNLKSPTFGASMKKLTDKADLTTQEIHNMIKGLHKLDTLSHSH